MNYTDRPCCDEIGDVQQIQIIISTSFMIVADCLLIGMAYCTNLRYHNYKMLLHYPGHTFKWTISYLLLIIFVFSAAEGILTDISRNEVTNPYLYIPQMLSLTSVIISLVYYHHMEYWDRPHLVWLLLLYWIMGIIGEVLAIFRVTDSLGFSSTIIRFDIGIIVIILYTCCAAAEINIVRKKIFSKPSHSRTIPRDFQKRNLYFIQSYTNSISSLTIWWLSWLVSLARRQTLELQNLGCLPETYEGKHILRMFKKAYRLEKDESGDSKQVPSLWGIYFRVHKVPIIMSTLLRTIYMLLAFIIPPCISGIVNYATQFYYNDIKKYDSHFVTVKEFFSNGFILVLVAGMSLALRTIAWSSSYGISADIGIKLRTSIQNMVYEKTLRLSTASTNDSSAGQTINHMSIDGSAVLWFFLFINCIISNPIQSYSDSRMRKTNELLQGIKFLKLSGWEELFASGITRVRNEEMKHKLTVGYYFLLSTIISQSLPFIVPFVIFAVYSQLYTAPLTPDVVFSVLAVANLLYQPLYLIPTSAKYIVEGLSSTKRLHHFLSLDEMSKYTDQELCNNAEEDDIDDALVNYELQKHSTKDTTPLLHNKINNTHLVSDLNKLKQFSEVVEIEKRKGASVEINNGYFRWESDSADTVLKDISVRFHAGTLTMIVGKVGSGKSSLLFAILGEMNTISGTVNYYGKKHKVAYVAQKTWLQYATLRDNIIFGEEFNKERYTTVLEVCALNSDLRMLPDGDLTEIGENGIILSGGQKQRVALARALYSKTEIVIMDDPLSALDAHVGAHVMEKAILGFLREQQRTVILVTHHMQHLEHADQVLVMESGQIIQKGNLSEIRKNSPYLYKQWQQLFSLISESECESGDDSVSRKSRRKLPNTILINTTRNSNGSILAVEGRKRGSAAWPIFLSYAKVMRLPRVCVLIMCFLMEVSGFVMINLWLSAWSQATQESLDNTMKEQDMIVPYYLSVYTALLCVMILVIGMTNCCFVVFFISSAKRLFTTVLYNIIHCPMRFFDTTPAGRILNRFSKDMVAVDLEMWMFLNTILSNLLVLVGSFVVNAILYPYFILLMAPIIVTIVVCLDFGVRLPRDLKRLDSVTLSPVLAHVTETYVGMPTIRSYGAEQRFQKRMIDLADKYILCQLYFIRSMQWMGLRLVSIGVMFFMVIGVVSLLVSIYGNLKPSHVGLAVTTGASVAQLMSTLLIAMVDFLSHVNGVERVLEYANIVIEKDQGKTMPPAGWPSKGSIILRNISVRYADGLDPILHNVKDRFKAGQKIGICGRTGSGKSSLALALLRIVDIIEGGITIDGIDISTVPLLTLRNRISIIPQDPVLFVGTIRFNLDPEGECSDAELWNALEIAQLKESVLEMNGHLDYIATEDFSMGQKQLFCLARAFLRKSKILIMDEATASIDFETDAILQNAIATAFADRTVLTIAHRISTILDSDTVLVLNEGRVIEYDTPQNLLRKEDSMFASLLYKTV